MNGLRGTRRPRCGNRGGENTGNDALSAMANTNHVFDPIGLLGHEVSVQCGKGRRTLSVSALFRHAVIVTRGVGETHPRERASEVRLAEFTKPTRSSMGNSSRWYEASSPHERYKWHEGARASEGRGRKPSESMVVAMT